MLGLCDHLDSEFCGEDEKRKKRLKAFLKLLSSGRRVQRRRKESNYDLKDCCLFIDVVIGQDRRPVSRDRLSPDAWQRAQYADLVF